MPDKRIEPGDVIEIKTTIRKLDGTPDDPGGLTFTMNAPGAAPVAYVYETGPEIVRAGLGVYYVNFAINSAGTHRYQWKSTGANAGVAEGSFVAKPLRVVAATLP